MIKQTNKIFKRIKFEVQIVWKIDCSNNVFPVENLGKKNCSEIGHNFVLQ